MIRKLLITVLIVTFVGMAHMIYEQQKSLQSLSDSNDHLYSNLMTCVMILKDSLK